MHPQEAPVAPQPVNLCIKTETSPVTQMEATTTGSPHEKENQQISYHRTLNGAPDDSPYPGQYNFQVFFSKAKETESKKTISYTYSDNLNKLYVRQSVTCPVHFRLDQAEGYNVHGLTVRATAVYSRPQDAKEPVIRCLQHSTSDTTHPHPTHLIRCDDASVIYEEETNGRRSVTTAIRVTDSRSCFTTLFYQFMCFSSCPGALNRRPTNLVLTLEQNGVVVGRQVVELRICACPGRDRGTDEQLARDGRKRKRGTAIEGVVASEKSPRLDCPSIAPSSTSSTTDEDAASGGASDDDTVYHMEIKGYHRYLFLRRLLSIYNKARSFDVLKQGPEPKQREAKTERKSEPQETPSAFTRIQPQINTGSANNAAVFELPLAIVLDQFGMQRYKTPLWNAGYRFPSEITDLVFETLLRRGVILPQDVTWLKHALHAAAIARENTAARIGAHSVGPVLPVAQPTGN